MADEAEQLTDKQKYDRSLGSWQQAARLARPLVLMYEDPRGLRGEKKHFNSYYDEGGYTNAFGVRSPSGQSLTPGQAFERYLTAPHSEPGKIATIMKHMKPDSEQGLTPYQQARIYSFVHNVTERSANRMLSTLSESGYDAAVRYMDSVVKGAASGQVLGGLVSRRKDEALLGDGNFDTPTSKGPTLRETAEIYNKFVAGIKRDDQKIALGEPSPPSLEEIRTFAADINGGKYDKNKPNENVRRFQGIVNRMLKAELDVDGRAGKNTKGAASEENVAKLVAALREQQTQTTTAQSVPTEQPVAAAVPPKDTGTGSTEAAATRNYSLAAAASSPAIPGLVEQNKATPLTRGPGSGKYADIIQSDQKKTQLPLPAIRSIDISQLGDVIHNTLTSGESRNKRVKHFGELQLAVSERPEVEKGREKHENLRTQASQKELDAMRDVFEHVLGNDRATEVLKQKGINSDLNGLSANEARDRQLKILGALEEPVAAIIKEGQSTPAGRKARLKRDGVYGITSDKALAEQESQQAKAGPAKERQSSIGYKDRAEALHAPAAPSMSA